MEVLLKVAVASERGRAHLYAGVRQLDAGVVAKRRKLLGSATHGPSLVVN
jgi:hypothetical protein